MPTSSKTKPWYVTKRKNNISESAKYFIQGNFLQKFLLFIKSLRQMFRLFAYSILSLLCLSCGTLCLIKISNPSLSGLQVLLFIFITLILFVLSITFMLIQIGSVCLFFLDKPKHISKYALGYLYLTSKFEKPTSQKGFFATDLILKQFVHQVRLYSLEKNYFMQKMSQQNSNECINHNSQTDTTHLRRRWADVQDTLDEFDIYLSQNIQDKIDNIMTKYSMQNLDVSKNFQEIAELFESTWRPKGINIEHAIVMPLKATTNEKLLTRLLVGPWRAAAYFAPKGGVVTFSAKNENNMITARWACLGLAFCSQFYDTIQNKKLSINERTVSGMKYISNQPQNSNILLGLISLIIWNDLASASGVNFQVKQENDGMIITLFI